MKINLLYSWDILKFQPIDIRNINIEGRIRLLEMTYSRMRISTSVMMVVIIPFLWAHIQLNNIITLVFWSVFYLILIVIIWQPYSQFLQESHVSDKSQFLARWNHKIENISILHGAGLSLSVLMAFNLNQYAFLVLLLVVIGHLQLIDVKYTPTFFGNFLRYLSIGCNPVLLLIPWVFPKEWTLILPLTILYSLLIYRHSTKAIQFNVNQILLEQEHQALAEKYKIAKLEAEALLKEKNQFLTTASHDLRQPVHAMGFLIESIARRNHDSAIEPALKDLKQSVRSVTQMFNSLLDLSKIESGKVELRLGNVYLDALIQEITTVFSEEARAKKLEIRIRPSGGNAIGRVDGTLLHQSIMNLMHNALRYTKQGGMLIAIRKRGKDWQIDVWDTGIGVAIEDQDRIYSPFYRNEHAWRIDSAGHGLGLSVVARCCEMMGCQYGFSSRLNRGSHFWLRVPALSGRLPSVRIVNETKHHEAREKDIRLSGTCLIVDDDPQVVTAWESLLSTWGVEVKCVESSKQALEVIANGFNPKVILCDQRLRAGESGFDVLRALLAKCPAASGAMISGEFDSPELKLAESEGYLVLHKPLEPDQLHAVLSRWLV